MKHSMTWMKDLKSGKVDVTYRDVVANTLDDSVAAVPPAKRVY